MAQNNALNKKSQGFTVYDGTLNTIGAGSDDTTQNILSKNLALNNLFQLNNDGTLSAGVLANYTPGSKSFNIGNSSVATGDDVVVLGTGASATAANSVAIGNGASDGGFTNSVLLGYGISTGAAAISIGQLSTSGTRCISIGLTSDSTGSDAAIAIGLAAKAVGSNSSMAIGQSPKVSGSFGSNAIGNYVSTGGAGSFRTVIGSSTFALDVTNSVDNSCAIGSSSDTPTIWITGGTGVAGSQGRVGVRVSAPTAFLHIAAGTATASTAPLKFTSGTNLTAAEAGAMEWDGTNLFITQTTGPTRKTIAYTTDIPTTTSGTYSPTVGNETNLDATTTATTAQYMRVGSVVTVSGRFNANPTLTATSTSFTLTLPVASNFANAFEAGGTAFCGSIAGQGAEIDADAANNVALITWVATDVTAQDWSYSFTYQII